MSSPTRLLSLLRYTEFAASAAKSIADVSAVPFLAAAASISLAILKTIEVKKPLLHARRRILTEQRAKTTKEQHVRILENIHHLLCSIIQVHSASGTLALHSPALSYEIGKITNTLQKIYTLLDAPKMGKIKQILKLGATSVRLAACDEELQHSVQVLKIQTNISSAAEMGVMKRNSEQHHERLVAVLSATDSSNSVVLSSSDQTQTLSSFSNSSASLSLIPGSPKVFYGREGEVKHVTDMLLHESAPRIAILGTGGMGKTSLSLAVLHGSEIAAKYPQRIFVSCHSSTSYPSLVSNIASYVGLETGPNLAKKLVRHFTEGGSALLVLDNFETPWELPSSRSAVEDLLSVLAGITHLAIVVTMRGAERPSKIKWTRPFLPALEPLSDDAALQIFADVADDDHDEASVKKLMALTGNLPLAVQLVANVASYEGCASTLLRWSRENTGTISEGHCKTSNLDISIMLSLSSSRMTPDALALLSVLSMLPDGLSDSELSNMELPIPNLHASKATLIRVSLAYKGGDGRLRVLVPIREYLRSAQPPTSVLKVALRKHFHGLMDLWDHFYQLPVREVVSQIVFNLGNLESVLSDGLNVECPDALTTIHSILCIQRFYVQTGRGTSPLILRLGEKINNWRDHFIYGDYLMQMVSLHASEPGETEEIIGLGRSHFEHADDLRKAQWNKHLAQYYWKQGNDIGKALEYSKLGLSLATSTGDWDNTSTLGLLNQTSSLMSVVGNYTGAREYAQKAQLAAELSGNLPAQATALCTQANCSVALADFTEAATLCRRAREIFSACGLEGCSTDLTVQMHEAEVHLLKTEYEARVINDSVSSAAARGLPISFRDTLAKLNLVAIGIASAAAPEYVLELLSTCRLQFQSLGYPRGLWYCDMTLGDLNLAQGDSQAARAILVSCYTSTRGKADGGAMFCLERLADYRHRLYDPQTTLGWTCVYIGAARKTGNKLALMKGLACIAEIFIAWGDDSTALSILEVTLSRFTYMGVHRWRADCFERMGEIYERRGQLVKACELWTSARPLFERSSQAQAVARLDSRLASVRSSSQSVVIPTSAITFPILTQSG